jgi:hypothetical protein
MGIYGHEGGKITEKRKLHDEELLNMYYLSITVTAIKLEKMRLP